MSHVTESFRWVIAIAYATLCCFGHRRFGFRFDRLFFCFAVLIFPFCYFIFDDLSGLRFCFAFCLFEGGWFAVPFVRFSFSVLTISDRFLFPPFWPFYSQ